MHKAQEAWPLLSAEGQKMLVWQMRGMGDYERRVRPRKTRLFEFALGSSLRPPASSPTGRVVEIGVGTGTNFPFMAAGGVREVIAVEPNPYFEPLAQEAAEKAGIALQVQQGRAEQMPFETGSVDTVVATLVMCSVDDVRAALSEIHRVLHPGGRYIFTEHVAAKDGSILRAAQEAANPLQMSTAAGCRLTRDPLEDIQRVFVAPNVHTERWTLLDETSESLAPHFLLSPHLSGFATRQ